MPGRQAFELLVERAAQQHGFLRPDDARDLGIDPVYLRKLTAEGRLENRARGLYRMVAIPPTPRDEYHEAVLWANGVGVIAGEAAIALWELADVNPRHIQLVLPPGYQLRRKEGQRYRILRLQLGPDDVEEADNIPVVTARIAITQAIDLGIDSGLVEQALANARARHLIGAIIEARLRVRLDERDHPRRSSSAM